MVVHNPEHSRFEIVEEGKTAELVYRLQPGRIVFIHTGVPAELEGRGFAKDLAVTGLQYARDQGLKVIPLCPFVASYIKRHPEYLDLVDEHYLDRVR
ncbi:MAG: GNAT family N-acetyltransferase [Bryobacteraceae bacterium]